MRVVPSLTLGLVLVLPLLVFLLPLRAFAQDATQAREKFMALEREVGAAFAAQDYETAATKCREQIALAPTQPGPHYNLACALARLGRTDDALASLGAAIDAGYDDAAHMKEDPDLENLRADDGFPALVERAEQARRAAAEKLYEPGAEIEGIESIEGAPEGGLRWRLRIAKGATAGHKQRLIVWLHPSGGSMNRAVEALSPELAKRGYALLVPTAKQWMSWSEEEAAMLLGPALKDVARVEALDTDRPLLMGFSAGGQMALTLWLEDPARFGGLILDAAYPIDPAAYRQRRIEPLALPTDDEDDAQARKGCPLYVLVGDQDGGHRVWKQIEEPWRAAGIPLTVDYVAGGRHEWLVKDAHATALLDWLAKAAGKPGE